MKIMIGGDGTSPAVDVILEEVKKRGHEIELVGAQKEGDEKLWPTVAETIGKAVASGAVDQGILFCWTGTGVTMAANKVPGVRAALCGDAETARGARLWNDANVLTLSLRALSNELAKEILKQWFENGASTDAEDVECLRRLKSLDD